MTFCMMEGFVVVEPRTILTVSKVSAKLRIQAFELSVVLVTFFFFVSS